MFLSIRVVRELLDQVESSLDVAKEYDLSLVPELEELLTVLDNA